MEPLTPELREQVIDACLRLKHNDIDSLAEIRKNLPGQYENDLMLQASWKTIENDLAALQRLTDEELTLECNKRLQFKQFIEDEIRKSQEEEDRNNLKIKMADKVQDAHKKRDDFADKADAIKIIRRIAQTGEVLTIRAIENHPDLAPYKNKYAGKHTLRNWIKEAFPDHNFKSGRPKLK
jgi:predicted RNase H-like nuclease (RuvC/YqgF family)